ncbi:MAG: hypothetical protein C0490_10215, partial [Marivirga sp.]|nr:hypothetical protein [Marivirga sp.]
MEFLPSSLLSKTPEKIGFPYRLFLLLSVFLISLTAAGQQVPLQMSDFSLFSGAGGPGTTQPLAPGHAVQLGSSSNITGGAIGSLKLVKTTGN